MKLLAFGEVLWDVYPEDKYIGGATLNFAAHFCLQNNESFLVSSVGNDDLAKETVDTVKAFNIDTSHLGICKEKSTGFCAVTLDKNSIPSYDLKDDVAYDYIDTSEINGKDFDAVYYGTLSLRRNFNRESLNFMLKSCSKAIKFCDLNIRPPYYSKEVIRFCIENADIIKISDEELPAVTECGYELPYRSIENSVEYIASQNPGLRIIIITMGANGSIAYDVSENKYYKCDAVKTKVCSTVGAGDSFSATFLSEYFKGKSLQDCLVLASKVSSFVVSVKDAVPVYTLDRFI